MDLTPDKVDGPSNDYYEWHDFGAPLSQSYSLHNGNSHAASEWIVLPASGPQRCPLLAFGYALKRLVFRDASVLLALTHMRRYEEVQNQPTVSHRQSHPPLSGQGLR